jgi:hypothetical protein
VGQVEDFDVIRSLVEKLQPGGQLGKILADKEKTNLNLPQYRHSQSVPLHSSSTICATTHHTINANVLFHFNPEP